MSSTYVLALVHTAQDEPFAYLQVHSPSGLPAHSVISPSKGDHMSFNQAKTALLDALRLSETPVIALHGDWGSGKTHLWNDILPEAKTLEFHPIYISCLNHNSIDALKSATLSALLIGQSTTAKFTAKATEAAIGYVNSKLPDGLKITTSLADLQSLLPSLLESFPSKPLIAFDDIERATDKIDATELLGFITHLTTLGSAKIILIINKNEISKDSKWHELREKVINMEIALTITTDNSISIGLGQMPQKHLETFTNCIKQLNITNIRTIQRMRRTYRALDETGHILPHQWPFLIPSIALFVGIHQGTHKNPLTIEQALNPYLLKFEDPEKLTEDQREAKSLLDEYKLVHSDEFESQVLVPYLERGYLDRAALKSYRELFDRRQRISKIEENLRLAHHRIRWDTNFPRDEINRLISDILKSVDIIDLGTINAAIKLADEHLSSSTGPQIAQEWISSHNNEINTFAKMDSLQYQHSIDGLHPLLCSAIKTERHNLFPAPSINQAFDDLASNRDENNGYIARLNDASIDELEDFLHTCSSHSRQTTFDVFSRYLRNGTPTDIFYKASQSFKEACRRITSKNPNSRLAKILMREFARAGMTSALTPSSKQ
ncbi:ATP-binding protein [Myxococcus sp. AM010]|uniref:ATP-binding protein n=1 Tax=Myxococcus sp. AM010 TaxID=2745138 RepID=UPI0015962A29|nr:ATP-binding protein [Myxococcus sp. AM010]NVJ18935.1 ATP-binding protein [Myxococcus sp. AM010]